MALQHFQQHHLPLNGNRHAWSCPQCSVVGTRTLHRQREHSIGLLEGLMHWAAFGIVPKLFQKSFPPLVEVMGGKSKLRIPNFQRPSSNTCMMPAGSNGGVGQHRNAVSGMLCGGRKVPVQTLQLVLAVGIGHPVTIQDNFSKTVGKKVRGFHKASKPGLLLLKSNF